MNLLRIRISSSIAILLLSCFSLAAQDQASVNKQEIIQQLDAQIEKYGKIAHEIWGLAELGFLET